MGLRLGPSIARTQRRFHDPTRSESLSSPSETKIPPLRRLTRHRRPNLTLTLKEINPFSLGQLFMLYEIQAVFSGGLYRINPLDQPGVEDGKVATYALMGRPGYESQKERLGASEQKDDKYVLAL